jgi:hypothetical protein
MREIARQATVAWGRRGVSAITAHDLYWVDIPRPYAEERDTHKVGSVDPVPTASEAMVWESDLWDDPQEPDQAGDNILKRKWENQAPSQRGGGSSRGGWTRGRGRGWNHRGGGRGGHIDM